MGRGVQETVCEVCEMRFLTPRMGQARHRALRAELNLCYHRLGKILYERGAFRGRRGDPLVPRDIGPIALLIAAKIRDLASEVEATRPG